MAVRFLDHLNITVSDLDASIEFYGDLFDFEVVEQDVLDDGRRWCVLKAGEAMLCIYEESDRIIPDNREVTVGDHSPVKLHGLNHFGLRLDDREAWEKRVADTGVTVLYGGPVNWPHSTAWYVKDPTGNEIEVVYWDDETVRFG